VWQSVAYPAETYIYNEVVSNFSQDIDLVSVYKLEVEINSERVHYYFLGHLTPAGKEDFLVIQEYYHGPEDIIPLEVNSFGWIRTTATH